MEKLWWKGDDNQSQLVIDLRTKACCEVERASNISSTIRSDRKEARLSFTSLMDKEKKNGIQALTSYYVTQNSKCAHLILLMMSIPDWSSRVLVTKLLGMTILVELAFTRSERRLLLFITWGHRDAAASIIDSNRLWKIWFEKGKLLTNSKWCAWRHHWLQWDSMQQL